MITDYEYTKWYYANKLKRFCHRVYEFYRDLNVRFIYKPYLIDTKLNRWDWHDTDKVLLYGCMNSLVKFVEEEVPFVYSDLDKLEPHEKEIKAIYAWWKDYENQQKHFDNVLNMWSRLSEELGKSENKKIRKIIKGDCDHLCQFLEENTDRIKKEETEYLIRLMKVRKYLWT